MSTYVMEKKIYLSNGSIMSASLCKEMIVLFYRMYFVIPDAWQTCLICGGGVEEVEE